MISNKQLALAITKRDRLARELAKADAALRVKLKRHADQQGIRGIPKLDVVRCQLRNAGVMQ